MIKEWKLAFVFAIVSSMLLPVVSAGPLDEGVRQIANFIQVVIQEFTPILQPILGDVSGSGGGDLFFAKLLIFVIIFSVVWLVLARMPLFKDTPWAMWITSIAVALLSARWIDSSDIINTIILPYSAFGVALTSLFPLIVYFFFVEGLEGHRTLRKICWLVAGVLFIGLYFIRYDEVSQFAWVYLLAAIVCGVFLFIDGTIQRAWHSIRHDNAMAMHRKRVEVEIRSRIIQIDQDFAAGRISPTDHKIIRGELVNRLRSYGHNL